MAGRGQKRGVKLPRRAKGVVRGSGAAAREEIRAILKGLDHLTKPQRSAAERRYVSLGAAADRLSQLVAAGSATSQDQELLVRTEKMMARVLNELGAGVAAAAKKGPADPLVVPDRRGFCEEYLTVAGGAPYSLKGREWQQTQFWDPLDGLRLWPASRAALCTACTPRVGRIVKSVYDADDTRTAEHEAGHGGCRGLHTHVIWLVALQLRRQQGKTAGVAGYALSSLFKYSHESIAYIAGSEDQSESLCRAHFGQPITDNEELAERAEVQRTRVEVPDNASEFELRPTSLAGTTGGSRTLAIVDEARDVPESIFAALTQQIIARNGWRCPSGQLGHTWTSGDLVLLEGEGTAIDPTQDPYGKRCTTCNARLEPWHGRIVAMSSAQELDGTSADWFHEMAEQLEREPEPDAHVFRTAQIINPTVSRQTVSRMQTVLSKVKGLTDHMAIEATGVSRRKGEPFLTEAQINGVLDKRLGQQDAGTRPAVGFLDTSETRELTSLVILEDDSGPDEEQWHRLVQVRLDVWKPSDTGGIIDERDVEARLRAVVPRFGLLALRIDDRLRPWAKALLRRLKGPAPEGTRFPRAIVRGCDSGDDRWQGAERMLAWEKFEERIDARTIRLFPDDRLRTELRAARRKEDDRGRVDIRETNRRRRHLDIAESVAGCCLMAHELAVKPGGLRLKDLHRRDAGGAARRQHLRGRVRDGAIAPRRGEEY